MPPTVITGINVASGYARCATFSSAAYSGVSVGDLVYSPAWMMLSSTSLLQIAERRVDVRPHVLVRLTGHHSDVDVEIDHVGDHVGLHAAMGDVRRERRVRARVGELGDALVGERAARLDDGVGVASALRWASVRSNAST